jgi:glycosyltransferase involved in cell wall biosynthesis
MSTDGTAAIAESMGARVTRRPWPGYGAQKNFGAMQATSNWILNIDADEVVTPELAAEIQRELAAPRFDAYRVFVPTYFMGRPLRHYGRAPRDPGHIRLFRRDRARFDERPVHESVRVDGSVGRLQAPVLHYCYPTLGTYWRKIHYYAPLEAQARIQAGAPRGGRVLRSMGKFGWMMVWRRGILDGPPAWIWIAGQAYQEWLTTGETARRRRQGAQHVAA